MRNTGVQLIRALFLFNMIFMVPAFGQVPIKAALVINMMPEPYLGQMPESAAPKQGTRPDLDQDYMLVNRCMHYPFRLEMANFSAREDFLVSPWWEMTFPARVELSIKWMDAQKRVQQRPVSFGNRTKDANFLQVMIKHEAVQAHKAYLESSAFWRFVGYPFALSDPSVDRIKHWLGTLNCYTFNHYVHFGDTLGAWPSFIRPKWRKIPQHTLRFGDLVGMVDQDLRDPNANHAGLANDSHFMMHLGDGLVLSKLGSSEDLIITDLDNGIDLYRMGNDDNLEVTAYRAR
jgi:hypothetical protein